MVLSSNDGCVISRSAEAKALGIPMGAPIFKHRELFSSHGVVTLSANFELYGDISERIATLLTSITPRIELYSIDEAFLDLDNLNIIDYDAWGKKVRNIMLKNIGIPVSIGTAPTKTLCKLANLWAKNHGDTEGVVSLEPRERTTPQHNPRTALAQTEAPYAADPYLLTLAAVDIADVWGVGWRLTPKLRAEGIYTALDLALMRPQYAQQLMGVHGRHMVYELNGTRCLPLQAHTKPQQMISRGRQFGKDTNDFTVIEAAIASLASNAVRELRREQQLAGSAAVVLRTNRLKPNYLRTHATVRFAIPTADTGGICSELVQSVRTTFRTGAHYHKADVTLYGLSSSLALQVDMLGGPNRLAAHHTSQARMRAVDALNNKFGPRAVRPAAELLSNAWRPRSSMLSPRYTSDWSELPECKAIRLGSLQ